jgi:hypothetical protein
MYNYYLLKDKITKLSTPNKRIRMLFLVVTVTEDFFTTGIHLKNNGQEIQGYCNWN